MEVFFAYVLISFLTIIEVFFAYVLISFLTIIFDGNEISEKNNCHIEKSNIDNMTMIEAPWCGDNMPMYEASECGDNMPMYQSQCETPIKVESLIGVIDYKGNVISPFKGNEIKDFRSTMPIRENKDGKVFCPICGEFKPMLIYYHYNWSCEDCLQVYVER